MPQETLLTYSILHELDGMCDLFYRPSLHNGKGVLVPSLNTWSPSTMIWEPWAKGFRKARAATWLGRPWVFRSNLVNFNAALLETCIIFLQTTLVVIRICCVSQLFCFWHLLAYALIGSHVKPLTTAILSHPSPAVEVVQAAIWFSPTTGGTCSRQNCCGSPLFKSPSAVSLVVKSFLSTYINAFLIKLRRLFIKIQIPNKSTEFQ